MGEKKNFILTNNEDVAKFFMSTPEQQQVEGAGIPEALPPTQEPAERGTWPIPGKRETKSKRVNLVMKPSVYKEVKTWAEAKGTSINEVMEYALLEFIRNHE